MKGVVSMKKTIALILALLLALSAVSALAASKAVKIDKKNFPDAAFRAYVKANFDTDGNGSLSKAEANSVESFHIGNGTYNDDPVVLCKNMKGIEHFPNLEDLGITGSEGKRHPLKSLDLSKNKKLVNLVLENTNVKKLDLSKNKNLCWLFASGNRLTSLTLGKKSRLTEPAFLLRFLRKRKSGLRDADGSPLKSLRENSLAAIIFISPRFVAAVVDIFANVQCKSYLKYSLKCSEL